MGVKLVNHMMHVYPVFQKKECIQIFVTVLRVLLIIRIKPNARVILSYHLLFILI